MVEKLYPSFQKRFGSEARNLLVKIMISIKNMCNSKGLHKELNMMKHWQLHTTK